jgi:hypothetical protein
VFGSYKKMILLKIHFQQKYILRRNKRSLKITRRTASRVEH